MSNPNPNPNPNPVPVPNPDPNPNPKLSLLPDPDPDPNPNPHLTLPGALQQWLRKYRELQIRAVSGVAVYKRVSETIGLDNSTFWDADGAALRYYEAIDPSGADKRTRYIMAYSRDEAWATAKEMFQLQKTATENDKAHLRDT